ncbi:MAG: phytanoyl-CoA dioxygenase family protein [Woeseiaceae bacterium]
MKEIDLDVLKADYDRDGFAIVRGYLSDADVDDVRERACPLAKELLKLEDDMGKYRNVLKSLHRHDKWFDQQLENGRHVPMLRHLLGGDIYGQSAAWFDRPEGESIGIGPHVDALGRNEFPGDGITIWYALDPVRISNGCLHYLRGSHKQEYPDVIPIPGIDADSEDAIAVELDPGDVVIHSSLTVHWSGGNSSGRPRRAVSYFYFGASAYAALHQRKKA